MLGGPVLRVGLVVGGMISAFGMFNALVMSYSRLPLAMAQDGMLPQVFGKSASQNSRALGGDPCLGDGLGVLPGPGLRAPGDDRHPGLWRQLDAGVRGAGCVCESGSPSCRGRSGFPAECSERSRSVIAPMLLLGFSVVRSEHETSLRNEFVRLRDDPDRSGRYGLLPEPWRSSRKDGSPAGEKSAQKLGHGLSGSAGTGGAAEAVPPFLLCCTVMA